MILVTGACGFIGTNLVKSLLADGHEVMAVDAAYKVANHKFPVEVLVVDSDSFRKSIRTPASLELSHIFHLGACADTTETNTSIMWDANVRFASEVYGLGSWLRIPIVYASSAAVYGNSDSFVESPANEHPENLYAQSKKHFDDLVRQNMNRPHTVAGLRFFNVYGPSERNKGRMASMPYQIYRQLKEKGVCRLFQGAGEIPDGGQRRDFVHVDDVVEVMKFFGFKEKPSLGIFNVGTGQARTFNSVAQILIERLGSGLISYVPFPESLVGKYQMNTCANLDRDRKSVV